VTIEVVKGWANTDLTERSLCTQLTDELEAGFFSRRSLPEDFGEAKLDFLSHSFPKMFRRETLSHLNEIFERFFLPRI
jgi:hypothetical protein